MVTLVALIVWLKPWYFVLFPWLAIACMDGAFLSSALTKVPDGAWVTITMAAVLASIFILWRFGKEQQWKAEAEDRLPTSYFIKQDPEGQYRLVQHSNELLSSNRGFGIFFDKIGDKTPVVFSQFIGKLVTMPDVMVFLHMRAVETPTVHDDERYFVHNLALPNCYRLVIRHGYMDAVITPDLAAVVFAQIRKHIIRINSERAFSGKGIHIASPYEVEKSENDDEDKPQPENANGKVSYSSEVDTPSQQDLDGLPADMAYVERAYDHRVLYVIGKEEMKVREPTPFWRKVLLHAFLFIRHNSRNKMANIKVPTDRLVEIGFLKEI